MAGDNSMRFIEDITKFIFVQDEPAPADIIFLPGGTNPGLPEWAAQLYHAGYAPLILPSGGYSVKLGRFTGSAFRTDIYSKPYQNECEFYTDVLTINGVPPQAIVPEDRAGYTRANAFLSRKVADAAGLDIRRAIICCKGFHARRCLMLYQTAFPQAQLSVVPVEVAGYGPDNWYKTEKGIDRVLGELSRCGNQFVPDIKRYLSREGETGDGL